MTKGRTRADLRAAGVDLGDHRRTQELIDFAISTFALEQMQAA